MIFAYGSTLIIGIMIHGRAIFSHHHHHHHHHQHHGWLSSLTGQRQDEGDNLKAMGVALQKEFGSRERFAKPIHSVCAGVYWYNDFFGIPDHKSTNFTNYGGRRWQSVRVFFQYKSSSTVSQKKWIPFYKLEDSKSPSP